jgi:predicted acyltransferase
MFFLKFRNLIITLGAVVCFVEFLAIDKVPSPERAHTVGVLHLIAAAYLLLTLILYITTWRLAWILVLRVLFAGFIVLMMGTAFMTGWDLITNS